eukprot:6872804-Prymnesium_polylepis.1
MTTCEHTHTRTRTRAPTQTQTQKHRHSHKRQGLESGVRVCSTGRDARHTRGDDAHACAHPRR